jgi:oligoribonuclease NrnB/cAMP/cGMP phosphodiesterase (DHH superfamily)
LKHIIYHSSCSDGTTSAWVVKKHWPDADLHPKRANSEPPEFGPGDDVIIVDFSYSREVLINLHSKVNSLLLIDHHKTAEASLAGLPFCKFDMSRSGASLAWDTLIGGPRPWLVDAVEDIDLWKWSLPYSKAVSAVLRMSPHTVEAYEKLFQRGLEDVAKEGENLLRYEKSIIGTARRVAVKINIAGYTGIPCTNSAVLQSDIGNELCKKAPFGIVWFYRDDGLVQMSFRSSAPNGVDVSEVAAVYGGGGHKHSSGCSVTLDVLAGMLKSGEKK